MVRRSVPQERGAKKVKKGKSARGGGGDDDYQQAGKLMLNNPMIPTELDEDIDDDLAFNSEDERMYGHLFNKAEPKKTKLTKKKSKRKSSGDDSDDDYLDEQFDAVSKAESRKGKKGKKSADDDEDLYNYHEDGQSSDGSDYMDLSDMLDESIKEEKKATKKKAAKKASVVTTEDDRLVAKKRRNARITEEAESIYGTADAGADGAAESYSTAVRNFVKHGGDDAEEGAVKKRIRDALQNKHNLLTMDMDESAKNRVTRKEVRAIVEENMSKYKPILRELNTSKHVQFPMTAPESVPTASTVGGIVAAAELNFSEGSAAPSSNNKAAAFKLASRMNALLSSAGVSRQQLSNEAPVSADSLGDHVKFDDNEDALSYAPQDQGEAPTHGYMAKLKAMLAYENSRRKRFNKIKSKAYRRILRKEKDREKERHQKAFELLHPELARKRLAEQLMKSRAEERVTQKHKNTSAWVKHAKRFAQFDANTKDAINDQHAIHQKLMQKIEQEAGEDNYERYGAGDDAGSEMSSEEERVVDELLAKVSKEKETRKKENLSSVLWQSAEAGEEDTSTPIAKARAELREMKFMKSARERENKEYEEQLDALREDIRRHQEGEEDASDNDTAEPSAVATSNIGKKSFTNSGKRKDVVEQIQMKKQKGIRSGANLVADDDDDSSYELSSGDEEESFSSIGEDENEDDAEETQEKKKKSPREQKKKVAKNTSEFAGDRKQQQQPKKKSTSTRVTVVPTKRVREEEDADASAVDNEQNVEEADLRLHQEYLISRAFAQDDVDEEFLKQKEQQVEAIMRPEDKNQSLPGWGEWGGEDEELNVKHQEKVAHAAVQKQIEKTFLMKSRADAALNHVIINHDGVDLVPDRMTLHMVPRPFSNPQEFSRSMRQPLGPEWSSALSFKDSVQPRVEVRQGHSVLPLDLSLRQKKNKTKRRKTETD